MRGKGDGYPPKREVLLVSPIAGAETDDVVRKKVVIKNRNRTGSKEESRWKK
jgi:hypothetical protein